VLHICVLVDICLCVAIEGHLLKRGGMTSNWQWKQRYLGEAEERREREREKREREREKERIIIALYLHVDYSVLYITVGSALRCVLKVLLHSP